MSNEQTNGKPDGDCVGQPVRSLKRHCKNRDPGLGCWHEPLTRRCDVRGHKQVPANDRMNRTVRFK